MLLFSSLLILPVLAAAVPTLQSRQLGALFERAVGDTCKAPAGSGTCRATSNCPGISYPTGLCPNDPADVQVTRHSRCIHETKSNTT